MDNRVFNVNGKTKEALGLALDLVLIQDGYSNVRYHGYKVDSKLGLALYTYAPQDAILFLSPLTGKGVEDQVWAWLNSSPAAKAIPHEPRDSNADLDGHTSLGWRVYNNGFETIYVKPAYLWYHK